MRNDEHLAKPLAAAEAHLAEAKELLALANKKHDPNATWSQDHCAHMQTLTSRADAHTRLAMAYLTYERDVSNR